MQRMIKPFLCRIGIHKWITVRSASKDHIRSSERYELMKSEADRMPKPRTEPICDDVHDRICCNCGKSDLRVEAAIERIIDEENVVWTAGQKHLKRTQK